MEIVTVVRDERKRLRNELANAVAIILRYLLLDADDLRAVRALKVIARHGVGYDNIEMSIANELGIPANCQVLRSSAALRQVKTNNHPRYY